MKKSNLLWWKLIVLVAYMTGKIVLDFWQVKVASRSSSSGNGRGVLYMPQRGDSTLACIVNKGICSERMVWCCVAAGCIILCKSYMQACFDFRRFPS